MTRTADDVVGVYLRRLPGTDGAPDAHIRCVYHSVGNAEAPPTELAVGDIWIMKDRPPPWIPGLVWRTAEGLPGPFLDAVPWPRQALPMPPGRGEPDTGGPSPAPNPKGEQE